MTTIGWITVDRAGEGTPWVSDAIWLDAAGAQVECARYGLDYPDREWAVARVVLDEDAES